MFKKAFNLLVALAFVVALLKAGNVSASNKGMISLWSVKVNSTQTVGSLWHSMPSYLYVCRSEKTFNLKQGETLLKVIFWPNFYGPNTMVSKDTNCELSNSPKGEAMVAKYTKDPHLYRQVGSNFYEPFVDLIYAAQARSFNTTNPKLVCRANQVGIEKWDSGEQFTVRFNKVIFSPYISPNLEDGGWLYASRDLICTTDVVTINRWLRNPYWTFIKLP